MIELRPFDKLGKSNHGWLNANFHFSFAEYRDPKRVHWGAMRSLFHTRSAPQCTRLGSRYSAKLKWKLALSQPWLDLPNLSKGLSSIMGLPLAAKMALRRPGSSFRLVTAQSVDLMLAVNIERVLDELECATGSGDRFLPCEREIDCPVLLVKIASQSGGMKCCRRSCPLSWTWSRRAPGFFRGSSRGSNATRSRREPRSRTAG